MGVVLITVWYEDGACPKTNLSAQFLVLWAAGYGLGWVGGMNVFGPLWGLFVSTVWDLG